MKLPIRFAVVGARRGRSFINSAKNISDTIKLAAVCDINEDKLALWRDEEDVRVYDDYQKMAENYCFMRDIMIVQNMMEQGNAPVEVPDFKNGRPF